MNTRTYLWATLSAATIATGCASKPIIEERPSSRVLDPIEKPAFPVGLSRSWNDLQSGETAPWEIQQVLEGGEIVTLNEEGCEWTVGPAWFPAAIEWNDCGTNPDWLSGTRTITSAEGELWPLCG